MRTTLGFLRHRYALLSLVVGALAIAAWGLYPRPASAQGGTPMPDQVFSTGPFMLQDGERVLIGLLMPGVDRARAEAQFFILDSSGRRVFPETNNDPSISGIGPRWTAFFDITYLRKKITIQTDTGEILINARSDDGILIGVLVPAIQRNGMTAPPLAMSMQSFNAKGGTMTYSLGKVMSLGTVSPTLG
jgi:hypothetical protein